MNSRKVKGGKVLPGALEMLSEQVEDMAEGCCTV